MNKVIENGQVAVLYSPGYGAGWYTWNESRFEEQDEALKLVFDPILVDLVKQKEANRLFGDLDLLNSINQQIENRANEILPDGYFGGVEDLTIMWVPIGTEFRIEEYDGSESIFLKENEYWLTA